MIHLNQNLILWQPYIIGETYILEGVLNKEGPSILTIYDKVSFREKGQLTVTLSRQDASFSDTFPEEDQEEMLAYWAHYRHHALGLPGSDLKTFPKMDKPILWVSGAGLLQEGKEPKLLLSQRPKGKHLEGLWELPGGKVEKGESFEEAVAREMEEEIDIHCISSSLKPISTISFSYDQFHLMMAMFTCTKWKGTIRPLENQQLSWATLDSIETYPFLPAGRFFVPKMKDILKAASFVSPTPL